MIIVNDKHSRLNSTMVAQVVAPRNTQDLMQIVSQSERIAIAGGRHSMGGQQFCAGITLVDMTQMSQVTHFDQDAGLITVQSGMMWPDLVAYLKRTQRWSIRQKQTGCDALTIGGALSSNVHGRGLAFKPIVDDIENFTLITHDGCLRHCDRHQNTELFRLAIGGYGMFGVIVTVTLRLVPRVVLRRDVSVSYAPVDDLHKAIVCGATYGDFQFNIDHDSPDFLRRGILSTYTPVDATPSSDNKLLAQSDWQRLLYLAHTDKGRAFAQYEAHYLATNGQLYWSDTFQSATYIDGYHDDVDKKLGRGCGGGEMISELYVPRENLEIFLSRAACALRELQADVIYGTVRLIEKDDETVLAWARESWACVIFNLHVDHVPEAVDKAKHAFRSLIDFALAFGGTYYLTYHRFASRDQLLACHPRIGEFAVAKLAYDPAGKFWSDWWEAIVGDLKSKGEIGGEFL
jgi:FAD/FMN-containing dehydrogenase